MILRDAQRPTASADVVAKVLDGEAVLLDLASGKYFGLNDVGTRVWELAALGRSIGEIRAALLAEFDVEQERLDADLAELFGALVARGLVRLD